MFTQKIVRQLASPTSNPPSGGLAAAANSMTALTTPKSLSRQFSGTTSSTCHRLTIIGGAPSQLSAFDIRGPDWLVFQAKDQPRSLLVPFSTPKETP